MGRILENRKRDEGDEEDEKLSMQQDIPPLPRNPFGAADVLVQEEEDLERNRRTSTLAM